MENAQLISLSRQIALQRQMDVVANNMANINTTGFKSENMLFEDYLMPGASDPDFTGLDQDLHYTEDWSTIHDMSTGSIEQTGNPLDVALSGQGFLTVQTPAGPRYTRNGSLQLDASGTLVDLNGNPVLGESGPIQFDAADTDVMIAANGAISTSQGSKGRLAIVEFADPQALQREGSNYYSGPTGSPATGTRVVQGAIERSNVSGVAAMTEMIRVERAYQMLASVMQRQDDLRNTAVAKLGDMTV
ncbi:MAG TPA: flagellar basal-body rod protein FlgF [Devosia sp.]|nr:flagellar basal-body rod protein FlgF [Devosia sp.]